MSDTDGMDMYSNTYEPLGPGKLRNVVEFGV